MSDPEVKEALTPYILVSHFFLNPLGSFNAVGSLASKRMRPELLEPLIRRCAL